MKLGWKGAKFISKEKILGLQKNLWVKPGSKYSLSRLVGFEQLYFFSITGIKI
jgi:hypothetical protein